MPRPKGLSGARNTGHRGVPRARSSRSSTTMPPPCPGGPAISSRRTRIRTSSASAAASSPASTARDPSGCPRNSTGSSAAPTQVIVTSPGPVRNVIGANMSVRRGVIAEIGGFRHALGRTASLPAGCEETELFIRADATLSPAARSGTSLGPRSPIGSPPPGPPRPYFRARCFAEGISKTQIARLVGTQDGLASERAYTTRTLPARVRPRAQPRGALRELRRRRPGRRPRDRRRDHRRRLRGRPGPGFRAVVGAAESGAERVRPRPDHRSRHRGHRPGPAPERSRRGRRATAVRSCSPAGAARPIGILDLDLGDDGLAADAFAAEIERGLGVAVPPPDDGSAVPVVSVHERRRAAVVIATRDRAESLARCLESVRRLDVPAAEIVVVDNHSQGPETAALARAPARRRPAVPVRARGATGVWPEPTTGRSST